MGRQTRVTLWSLLGCKYLHWLRRLLCVIVLSCVASSALPTKALRLVEVGRAKNGEVELKMSDCGVCSLVVRVRVMSFYYRS